MRTGFFKGVVLGAVVSTGVLLAASAVAGTGVGGVFNLGKTNTVNATTTLAGASAKTLQLQNTGTGPALGLSVKSGQPPLTTSSGTKVVNLNSDKLDGIDSTGFVQGSGRAVRARVSQPAATAEADILVVPGFGSLRASCLSGDFAVNWKNVTSPSASENLWWVKSGTNHNATIASSGGEEDITTGGTWEMATLQVSSVGHVATITISGQSFGLGGCLYAAQAVAQ